MGKKTLEKNWDLFLKKVNEGDKNNFAPMNLEKLMRAMKLKNRTNF